MSSVHVIIFSVHVILEVFLLFLQVPFTMDILQYCRFFLFFFCFFFFWGGGGGGGGGDMDLLFYLQFNVADD